MPKIEDFMAGGVDQYMGDEYLIGAPAARARRAIAPSQRAAAAAQLRSPMPGVPQAGARIEPLGFAVHTFLPAAAVTVALTSRPQKPFKGGRLVIDVAKSPGASALIVTVASLLVGSRNVLVSAQPVPATAFQPNSYGSELNLDECQPGIDIVLNLAISAAPGAGESVAVSSAIFGLTWA